MSERGYLATLRVRLTAEISSLREQLATAQGLIKVFVTAAAAVLLTLGAAALTAADQVDDALDTIRIGTGATGDALASLEGSFATVFASVPNDSAQVAQALADLNTRTGQTGEGLERLSTQVLTLSRIAKTDLGSTISTTTRLFGDWGIAVDRQSDTLDFLFRTSQATGIGVDTLAGKLVQFGAPLRQMGFSFEQSAALMGKWEKEGVNAELVLGSLRIALGNFAKAGKDAPAALQEVIQRIQELGPGAQATALAMETFGRRAGADMAAAITEGRFAIDDLLESLRNSSETIEGAAADTDGWREALAELGNRAKLALSAFGTPVLVAFNKALRAVMADGDGVVQALYRVGQAATVVGAVLLGRLVPGFVATTVAAVANAVALIRSATAMGILTAASNGLKAALAWFGGGWGLAATLVLAAVGVAFLEAGRRARQAAAEARQAAEEFRAALMAMDQATLDATMVNSGLARSQVIEDLRVARAALAELRANPQPEFQMRSVFTPGGDVQVPTGRLTEYGAAVRDAVTEVQRLTAAEERYGQQVAQASAERARRSQQAAVVVPDVGGGGGGAVAETAKEARRAVEILRDRVGVLTQVRESERALGRDSSATLRLLNAEYENAARRLRAMGDASRLSPEALQDYRDLLDIVRQLAAEGLSGMGPAPLRPAVGATQQNPVGMPAMPAELPDLSSYGRVGLDNARAAARFLRDGAVRARTALREGAEEAARRLEQAGESVRTMLAGVESRLIGALPSQVGDFVQTFRESRAVRQVALKEGVALRGAAAVPPLPMAAVSLAAMEFLSGVAQELGPALSALLVPFRILGEIVGRALVPVVQALWPLIQQAAISFTYLVQAAGYVAYALLKVTGEVIAAIGDLISRIPGLGEEGAAIERFGRGLVNAGDEMLALARSMPGVRDELRAMTWADAMDRVASAANRAAFNLVEGFKASNYRFAASDGRESSADRGGGTGAPQASASTTTVTDNRTFHITVPPPEGMTSADFERWYADVFLPGVQRLSLAHPHSQATVAGLPG